MEKMCNIHKNDDTKEHMCTSMQGHISESCTECSFSIQPTQPPPLLSRPRHIVWNSRQKATQALFVIEYESNLHVKA